ncbi:MAG: hypothetical protein H5U04_11995 [Firmicutes bacterium]|nr:hypothetical protein [Bacillota bacterium]
MEDVFERWRSEPGAVAQSLAQEAEAEMRREWYPTWERWRRKYRNKWYLKPPQPGLPGTGQPVYSTNYIFSTVQIALGYVRENPPVVTLEPVESGDREEARLLTEFIRADLDPWFQPVLRKAQLQALLLGTSYLKTYYSPEHGRAVIDALAPEEVLLDPLAQDWSQLRFLVHRVRRQDPGWARVRYGLHLDAKDKVDIDEFWMLVPEIDAEGNLVGSRWEFVRAVGAEAVSEPQANPYNHAMLPVVPLYAIEPDQGLLGIGVAEVIEPLQDQADALDMQIYRIIRKTANRWRFVGSGAGIDASQIRDDGGSYNVADPNAIRWDTPPTLPGEVFAYRADIDRRIQLVSGIFDVVMGQTPRRITAASAISLLQDAAYRRIGSINDSFAASIALALYQYLHVVLQFYPTQRFERVLGSGVRVVGNYPEGMVDPAERERWKAENGIALVLGDVKPMYDVRVSMESALPQTKSQRARIAMELRTIGVLDDQAVLEALEWPDWEEIVARKQAAQVQAMPSLEARQYENMPAEFNPLAQLAMQTPKGGP